MVIVTESPFDSLVILKEKNPWGKLRFGMVAAASAGSPLSGTPVRF